MATQYTLTKTLCVIGLSSKLERLLSIHHTNTKNWYTWVVASKATGGTIA